MKNVTFIAKNVSAKQKGNNMKLNWRKIWREFDLWLDKKEESGDRFPEWSIQARKINQLVSKQFEKEQLKSIPKYGARIIVKLKWGHVWRSFDKQCKNYISTLPDWSIQKEWIKKIINKELRNAVKTNCY